MSKKSDNLYNAMKSEGLVKESYNDFLTNMRDPSKRVKLFNKAQERGFFGSENTVEQFTRVVAPNTTADKAQPTTTTRPKQKGFTPSLQQRIAAQNTFANTTANFNTSANALKDDLRTRQTNSRKGMKFGSDIKDARLVEKTDPQTGKTTTEIEQPMYSTSGAEVINEIDKIRQDDANRANASYVEMQKFAETPQGKIYMGKALDTEADYNAAMKYLDDEESRLSKQLDEAKRKAVDEFNSKSWWQRLGQMGPDPAESTIGNELFKTEETSALEQSMTRVQETRRHLEQAHRVKSQDKELAKEDNGAVRKLKNFGYGTQNALRGFANTMPTWLDPFDLKSLEESGNLGRIVEKQKNGKQLTKAEQDMLDAEMLKQSVESEYDTGTGYGTIGQTTGEMANFAVRIALNPLNGFGAGLAKGATRFLVKNLGKSVATKLARGAIRLGGDIVEGAAMALTTGGASTVDDVVHRHVGNFKGGMVDGNWRAVGTEGGESWGTAIAKGVTAQTIEGQSELVGEYFAPILKGIGKYGKNAIAAVASKLGGKAGEKAIGKAANFIAKYSGAEGVQLLNGYLKRAGWHGSVGEFAEEIVGGVENAITVHDQTLDTNKDTGVFNWDNMVDTALGVGVSSLVLGHIGAGGYAATRVKLNRSYNSALKQMLEQFGDKGEAIQNKMDEMNDQQFTDYVSEQLQNKNLNKDQRSALWGYAKALKAKQYLSLSEASDVAKGLVTLVDQNKDRAYTIGYNSNGQNIGAQLTSKAKLYDDATRRFGKKRTAELQKMTDSDAVNSLDNDRDKQMWLDVINSREAYRGAIQSMVDNKKDELADAYRNASGLADANGNVVTATDTDGNKVNIISGEIVRDDNGNIDNEKSGKLVVVDADGKRRMVEASAIASVDNTTSLKDYFEPIGQGIMDKYITEEAMQKLVVGNTLLITSGSAEPVQATIVNIDANGNVSYYIGDNPQAVTTMDATSFLYSNMYAETEDGIREPEGEYGGRVRWNPQNQQGQQTQPTAELDENGEQINPQINETQPTETEQGTTQESEQTTEPKAYQQGQQVSLADENGNQVNATIDSQPNEDGKFIVTFDKPINGARVAQLSADEISALEFQQTESQTETDENDSVESEPTGGNGASTEINKGGQADSNGQVNDVKSSALSRIPKDKKGQPIYEQTDANTAWDAIVEQTEGDEELAKTVADSMVADKEAALKKAEKLKGKGATVSEKIANVKAVAQAEAELAHWKEIASTLDRRKQTTEETTSNAEESQSNAEESTETAPQATEQVNEEKPTEEKTPVEETAPTEAEADKTNAEQPTEVKANEETETAPVAETETTTEDVPTEETTAEVKEETAPTEVTDTNKPTAEVETKEEAPTEGNAETKKDNRSNLFQYFTGSIKELIEAAKDAGNKLVKKIIAPASNKLVEELKEKGVDISTEYNHVIDNNAINHTLNNHSDEKEELRGQVPLTVEDIEKASDIIDNYDEISTSKNKRGQDVVIYKKHYEDGTTLYVEEVRVGRKELALASMRKYKSGKLTDAKSDAPLISDLSAASQGKGNTPDGTKQEQKQQTADNGVADGKIEDVGEKIGGAKKDKYAEMKQRIREDSKRSDDDLLEFFRKNPVSKIFNFDFAKLREGGASNEAVSFVVMVKNSIPAKPRTAWKLKSWASDLLTLYRVSLVALTNFDKVQEILNKHNDSLTEHWNAYMAVGGFDGGLNIGKAGLRQLSKESYTFKDGQRISNEGKWYLNNAGAHGGIYDTKEEAVEALKAFAGKNAVPKDKQIKFEVYGNRTTGEVYITPKGKADVVIQGGFKSVSDAFKYLEEHNAELQERYRTLMDKTKVELGANRERKGRDYRGGKDVSADGFMQTFGFRGVEFGNWMKQGDRAKALNECYDALMDLADVCGVSPKALSLDGKLGMAFGSRGGGNFNAHYEPGKEVINLTKTKGSGSLAHEWFHALDNYFAKMGGAETRGFATSSNGMRPNISDWGNGKYRDLTNHKMITKEEYEAALAAHPVRKEMADAWEHLIKQIRKSDYGKRSMAYAGLHNSKYWSEATEMGARAFSAWVENELSKRNATNDYLANDPKLLEETLDDDEKRFKPYPFNSDAEWMDEAFGNLFSTMQERVDEESGNHVLYSKKTAPKSKLDIVREMAERADAERKAGTRAVRHAKVKGRKAIETVADALGYKVEWVPTDSRYNGKVDHQKKVITIAEDAEMPLEAVMGHEATHAIRRLGEEQYTKLRDAVRELVGEDAWNALIEQKRTEGNYTDDKVEEEVTADLVGRVISDGKMMGGLAQKLKGEPTILGKLREIFQRMVDALTKLGNTEAADVMKRNLKAFDAVVESFTEAAEKRKEAIDNGVSSVTDAAAVDAIDGKVLDFNMRTEKDVQKKLRTELNRLNKSKKSKVRWSKEQIDNVIEETESLINLIHSALEGNMLYDEWAKKEPTLKVDWRDGKTKPVVTWARNNVEYKYDASADLLCINNEGIEATLSSPDMVELMLMMGESGEGFTSEDYMRLYEVMRDLGLNVPCKGCFDAAARLKMLPSVSQNFVDLVNATIDERNKDPEAFDAELRNKSGKKTANGLPAGAKTKEDAIRVGVAGDNLTEHIDWTQLMSAEGQTKALSDWGGIFRAWQRTGAGRPKDKLLPEPYNGTYTEQTMTIIAPYGEKTPKFDADLVNRGTALRRNSHSEFRPILAIDEIQSVRDAYMKGLCMFKYMKELDDVRLFGKMGIKFNMSFFPAFDKKSSVAGLDADGNYIASEESVGSREFTYKDKDGKQHFDGMRGLEEAKKYINEDVSLSSVVFSIPHFIKCLTDVPTPKDKRGIWGSLIPFHSSGATTLQLLHQGLGMARANGVGHAFADEAFSDYGKGVTNFEDVQNDRFGKGWTILEGKKAGENVSEGHKLEFVNGTHYYNAELGVHLFGSWYVFDNELSEEDKAILQGGCESIEGAKAKNAYKNKLKKSVGHPFEIDYNDKVRELGGEYAYKEAADYYADLLPKLGLIPRFDFNVPEAVFLKMCADAKVEPQNPKLGWKGKGHDWSPKDSDAYYSVWCDFGMTDPKTGKYAPHRPVGYKEKDGSLSFKLPKNTVDIVREGVNRYTEQRELEKEMHNAVMTEYVKRTVADGKLTKEQGDAFLNEHIDEDYSTRRLKPDTPIKVVEAEPNHGFANYNEAKEWARDNIVRTYNDEETNGKGNIRISNTAIGKFLSQSAVDKSDSKDVHLAVLKVLPDVIRESVDAEQPADFLKGADGVRRAENGINPDVTIHRLYGAVNIDGKTYRVKTTIKQNVKTREDSKAYSYEATKIELLDGQHEDVTMTSSRNSNNSISAANLLKGVKKSYSNEEFFADQDYSTRTHTDADGNRTILNELVNRFNKAGIPVDMTEEGQRVIDAVNDGKTAPDGARMFRTRDGEVYGFVKDGKVYLDPRIATSETAIHEYTHLFGDMVRATDSKQWAHLVKELKGTDLWSEVKQTYKELKTDDEIADEVFATFSGRHGAERIDQEVERILASDRSKLDKAVALAALQNVRDAIRSFWRKVAELFGIHRMRSAEELADMALADLLDAKNPINGETAMQKRGETGKSLATSGTYFSGGGLLEEGLKGIIDPKVAVEYSEKIAGVYADNHGNHIVTADVRNVDPKKLVEAVDGGEVQYFHASPVCKNFSTAKHDNGEVALDIETAKATADFIAKTQPKVVTVENVKGYRDSEALKIITDELTRQGYDWDADVYNAADFGGYTKRERLIVRAKRDGKLPPKPKALPKELRKHGWLDAVVDLIDSLPEKKSGVPSWMDERLKAEGIDYRNIDRPLYVFGQGNSRTSVSHAFADELLPTLRTHGGDIIVMPDGRVLKATPRVLARITGLSDDYKMPATDDLAHTVIGNGIPAQLTKGVVGPLLDNAIPYDERASKIDGAEDLTQKFHSLIDQMFGDDNFDNTQHLRERYSLGKTPEWMKQVGIVGDEFSLSFKNIKIHKGKDSDHDLTREEWHKLPEAIKHPFAVTEYQNSSDRFRLYVNIFHDGKPIAVGVDVKRVNQGKDKPQLDVNSIKTVFAYNGAISASEKLVAYDKNITPEQEALLRGLNFHEYPTIQELSATNVEKNSEQSNNMDGENNDIRFSRQDNTTVDYSTRAQARDRYETRVKSGLFQTQESLQNSMLGLQEALLAVDRASGNKRHIEDIEDWENPVLGENRLSSVNKAEIDAAASLLFRPLMETVSKLTDHGKNMQELTDYMMAKHGLERNLVMAEREAKKKAQKEFSKDLAKAKKALAKDPNNKTLQDAVKKVEDDIDARATTLRNEYRLKDYAGITALAAEYDSITASYIDQIAQVDEQISQTTDKATRKQLQAQRKVLQSAMIRQAESVAQQINYDYETKHANDKVNVNGVDKMLTTVLWEQTNAVTGATLDKAHECGFLTNEQYADISSMYSFYIPLRGFDAKTSAEAYAYLNHEESAFNAPIKRAKGRKSKADDPFAYMQTMMESGIIQGNRNVLVKQSLLNFALNHPSDLMSVSELWLQYDAVNDEWTPVTPTIDENHPTKTVAEQMNDFETSMQNLSAQSPNLYKKASDAVDIPYRVIEKTQLNEHQVLVRKNGKDYIVTINGNPRAAQATNGLTNPDSEKGAIGAVLSLGDAINRKLAAFYTTRNPDFTMSNFVRDMIYSNTMVWVKESPSYALTFHKNCAKFNPVYLTKLFKKWEAGELNLNEKDEKLIYEFMRNGGETGYVAMKDIEQRKSDIAKEIKRIGKCSAYNGWRLLIDEWDGLNRSVENCARVAAYVTSREKGRSIGRAVFDAKEISVNFNRKGSGATFVGANEQTKIGNMAAVVSGLGRCGYLFWNAGIQGLTNYGRQFKRHPAKAWSLVAGLFLAGFIKALAGGDDDDDENNYYNLPEYVRRSSICVKAGDSWVTIPLSVEYRSMYGLGELAASVATGHESGDTWEITQSALGQVSQILPLDLMEGGGGHALIPSSVKPAWEAFHNEGWTGLPIYKETPYNKYMPNWTKAYKSTNKQLVNFSAMLNEWTGGDDYTKGGVDLNPARIEYIMRGYLGGMFGLTNNLVKVAEITTGKRDFEWQSVPIADRFIKTADERTQYRALSNEYYKMKEEADETSSRASGYLKGAKMGKMEYLKKLDEFMNSPAYERKLYFDAYDKAIKKIREAMQYTTDTKQLNEMQQDIYKLQREALNEIDSISSVNK